MDSVLIGLCFVLLNFSFNGFDVLPDCVGYFFMFRGLGQLASESRHFAAMRPWCAGMAVVTLFLIPVSRGHGVLLLGGAVELIALVILERIVQGMTELQQRYTTANFEVATLRSRWTFVLAAQVCVFAAALLRLNGLISGIIALAAIVIRILFLMVLHRGRLAYHAVKP